MNYIVLGLVSFISVLVNAMDCGHLPIKYNAPVGISEDGRVFSYDKKGRQTFLKKISDQNGVSVFSNDNMFCDNRFKLVKSGNAVKSLSYSEPYCIMGVGAGQVQTFEFGNNNGKCFVNRIREDLRKVITYDSGLCDSLVKLYNQMGEKETNACVAIIQKMSDTITQYQAMLKKNNDKYALEKSIVSPNPYHQALKFTNNCFEATGHGSRMLPIGTRSSMDSNGQSAQ